MIQNKKYVLLPEFQRGFLQGREVRETNTPTKKSIKLSSETPEQGLVKEDDNKDNEIEEVEDKDMND